jgi:hypothetical protein
MSSNQIKLSFVTCVSSLSVLEERLLASPCLQENGYPLLVYVNAPSAGHGFNSAMAAAQLERSDSSAQTSWLVWVHQDVFLPRDWDAGFTQALAFALERFPKLAVTGVYGVAGTGAHAQRAGHVLDRGTRLREPAQLPCLIDSLDELLFAVRVDTGLRLDPDLGFDFYATDLVLQAQASGWQCAVVEAYCEHWSGLPSSGYPPEAVAQRILTNGAVFERKWNHRLPLTTPCFEINQQGDVALSMNQIMAASVKGSA